MNNSYIQLKLNMSTSNFIKNSSQETEKPEGLLSSCLNKNVDFGYYGSSDYSDTISSSANNIAVVKNWPTRQQTKYIYNNLNAIRTELITTSNTGTVSSSSFTSASSILSSPTTSANSNLMNSPKENTQQNPKITNLYPYSNQDKNGSNPVNIYLERFEKIYNSNESNLIFINNSNKMKNIETTYSYV